MLLLRKNVTFYQCHKLKHKGEYKTVLVFWEGKKMVKKWQIKKGAESSPTLMYS